jgi:DNA-binding NtrC family response regulator
MLHLFRLEGTGKTHLDTWVSRLALPAVEFKEFGPPQASSAVWRGQPFIIAGNGSDLDSWFGSLDKYSSEILSNCAYFWVLTSSAKYHHSLLPVDRIAVLDWNAKEQHIVRAALSMLARFPRLAGLSNDMEHLREEILRLARGVKGPSSPVLILGETGSGKEEVAQSLVKESPRAASPGLGCIGGASLNLDPGLVLSQLVGIPPNVATQVKGQPGLLEQYSEGALFIDDFDTAPRLVQEQLLRITATPKGQKAEYRRVGGDKAPETNVWLLFATNADIETMLDTGHLRADFLYRFEDRVLLVPPLRDRPGDFPAIAYHVWSRLLNDSEGPPDDRVLPWRSVRDIWSRKLEWKGNVRELSGLLGLVVSMTRMPRHREHSTGSLIEQVLARGQSYTEWFTRAVKSGILSGAPAANLDGPIREILTLDSSPASKEGLSACELAIKQALGDHWPKLRRLAKQRAPGAVARIRRHFCRYLFHALRLGAVSIIDAEKLGNVKNAQARKHLEWLAHGSVFLVRPKMGPSNTKLLYRPGRYFARAKGFDRRTHE